MPRGERRIAAALALLVWFSCAWFGSWEGNPNNATRLFAAISLVEDGNATIDEFAPLTIDKARFGGHYYLDKAPGMTLMALPAVALANWWTGEHSASVSKRPGAPGMARFLRLRLRVAVATGPAVLTAVAAALLFDLALGLTGSGTAALLAALGFALGTPVWGWSTTIFGHAAVAALFVVALWSFWRATAGLARPGLMALGGAALGWAVAVEYQAVLAGAVLALFGLIRAWPGGGRWRLLGAAMAGGVAAMLPLVGYNLVAFGTPFKLGYQGVVGFEGMNRGLFGLSWPDLRVLWEVVIGTRRGLLWVAPVLVVAPLGLIDCKDRRLAWSAGLAALVVLLVNAGYVYWDGGNATGPRHAVPAIGLLAVGLAPFWGELQSGRSRMLTGALLVLSVAINLLIAACDVFAPPTDPWPLHWVWTQHFRPGDVTSIAGDYLGWPEWTGLVVWAAVAVPMLAWLSRAAEALDPRPRVRAL